MAAKSSNDNSSDFGDKTPQTKIIQKFIKQDSSKNNFKQEDHDVQLVLEIKTLEGDEIKTREYNTKQPTTKNKRVRPTLLRLSTLGPFVARMFSIALFSHQ